jgi:hypothetical protein
MELQAGDLGQFSGNFAGLGAKAGGRLFRPGGRGRT